MEVPREGRTRSRSPTCPVPSPALGPSTTLHHPVCSRRQGEQRAALGDPCTLPSESLLQRRRDHKARDCPQPQRLGLTWSTQCAVSSSVPFVSGQASELQLKGLGACRSLSAHVLNLAPHSSSGEWHVHRRPGSSGHPGQNEASPWEDSSSWWGCEHPARYPEAHVGSRA